jgi:pyruvate formate lyase activating enzyme
MLIKGLQKTTLLDFPGRVACTVFTGGCNFRCPFCHNASLVTKLDDAPDIPEQEVLSYLSKRKGILDGVCITGGEPLLQPDIISFLEKIKKLNLLIKIDTNGSRAEILEKIISLGLADYIAMDIKNSFDKYAMTCGLNTIPENTDKSIDLIMNCGIPYEFRTTVVKELHDPDDIQKIAERIKGANGYFLQGFIDSGNVIGGTFSAYTPKEMDQLLKIAQKYVPNASLRGIDI